jgi:hypothetical protein
VPFSFSSYLLEIVVGQGCFNAFRLIQSAFMRFLIITLVPKFIGDVRYYIVINLVRGTSKFKLYEMILELIYGSIMAAITSATIYGQIFGHFICVSRCVFQVMISSACFIILFNLSLCSYEYICYYVCVPLLSGIWVHVKIAYEYLVLNRAFWLMQVTNNTKAYIMLLDWCYSAGSNFECTRTRRTFVSDPCCCLRGSMLTR